MEDDFELTISPQAQTDIHEIFQFYEMMRIGKGSEFAEELYQTLDRIQKWPSSLRLLDKNIRFGKLKKHPYVVYFLIKEDVKEVVIFTILPEKCHPDVWKRRLKNL